MLARVDWHTFIEAIIHRQANMVLYYGLLRGWIHAGDSESWIRFLSVVFGVASIPVVYRLGELVLGSKPARIAALLLTLHAFHIAYSQEARGYSLVVLLVLLSCYFFLRLTRSRADWTWFAYVLSTVLMVYAQVLGVLLLPAQWLYAAFRWKAWSYKKRTIGAAATITLFVTPLVVLLLLNSDRSQLAWMNQRSSSTLYNVLLDLSGRGGMPLLILNLTLLAGSGLLHWRKNTSVITTSNFGYGFLWLWGVLPIVIIAVISIRWPIVQGRYLLLSLPAFLLLVADGLAHIRWRTLFVAAFMTIVAMSLTGVASYFRSRADLDHSDNWRDATYYLLSEAQPGDAVLFPYSAEEIAFREYQIRFVRSDDSVILVPRKTDLELLSTAGTWTTPQMADNAASQHSRVWMISALQADVHSHAVQVAIEGHLAENTRRHFGFVMVRLFAGPGARAQ